MRIASPFPINVFGHLAKSSGRSGSADALLLGVVAVVQADADDLLGTRDHPGDPTTPSRTSASTSASS